MQYKLEPMQLYKLMETVQSNLDTTQTNLKETYFRTRLFDSYRCVCIYIYIYIYMKV